MRALNQSGPLAEELGFAITPVVGLLVVRALIADAVFLFVGVQCQTLLLVTLYLHTLPEEEIKNVGEVLHPEISCVAHVRDISDIHTLLKIVQ